MDGMLGMPAPSPEGEGRTVRGKPQGSHVDGRVRSQGITASASARPTLPARPVWAPMRTVKSTPAQMVTS